MQYRFLALTLFALSAVSVAGPAEAAAGAAASTPVAAPAHAASAWKQKKPAVAIRPVDINSASRAQLMKLPGVDDALAAKIIANRPYLTKAELVTKQVMPKGPFLALKSRIVAVNKTPPKAAR